MITKYFKDYDKKLVKKSKPAAKSTAKKGGKKASSKGGAKASVDIKKLKEQIGKIIPSQFEIDTIKPIDSGGFSPDGTDLIIYKKYYPDILDIMGGYIPYELIYGSFFMVQKLDKESLAEVLNRIVTLKKLNKFTGNPPEDQEIHIPTFIVAADTNFTFFELKNEIVNYYLSKNIEHDSELDILMVLNRGLVVKNWRDMRSFIALETKKDTQMWFFILLNEYLEIERRDAIDFRKYVKTQVVYNEY